jgi:hypothetical protein
MSAGFNGNFFTSLPWSPDLRPSVYRLPLVVISAVHFTSNRRSRRTDQEPLVYHHFLETASSCYISSAVNGVTQKDSAAEFGAAVGTLFPSVHSHSPDQRFSLFDCHLLIIHYQRNAARLQQLFEAFRWKSCIHGYLKRNPLPGRPICCQRPRINRVKTTQCSSR